MITKNSLQILGQKANAEYANTLIKQMYKTQYLDQRDKIGMNLLELATEENILLPYTSLIYIETPEQQQRIDELLNEENKFNQDRLTGGIYLQSTGQSNVWIFVLLALLFILLKINGGKTEKRKCIDNIKLKIVNHCHTNISRIIFVLKEIVITLDYLFKGRNLYINI